jgi:hypothetical protein
MQLIFDLILLAASAAAAVYCFVLSARLKKLNDVRSGLGASVVSMSAMLDQTRLTLEQSKRATVETEQRLRAVIEHAEKIAPEIEILLDAVAESAESAESGIENRRRAALADIRKALTDPRVEARQAGLAA